MMQQNRASRPGDATYRDIAASGNLYGTRARTGRLSSRVAPLRAGILALFAVIGTACADSMPTAVDLADQAPQISTSSTTSIAVSNVWVATGKSYAVVSEGMTVGAVQYIDRNFPFVSVPAEIQGATYIRTAAMDRDEYPGRRDFLTFTTDRDATIYVAHHNRIARPAWLKESFTDTGLDLKNELYGTNETFRLFKRDVPAGKVTLGSNVDSPTGWSMYSVVVKPLATTAPPPPDESPSSPDFATIKKGVRPRGFAATTYVLAQPASGGKTYYVATSGNDANAGTSSAPFRTINRAAQVAVAGDVVTIRNGTYQESVLVRYSGTAAKRIVFQAESRGGVVLTGGKYVFRARDHVGQIGSTAQNYITVRGLIFRDYAENQDGYAALRAARGWRIEDCLFDRSAHTGITISDHDVVITRSTLQYHHTSAYTVYGGFGGQGTSPSDPAYTPVLGLQLTDLKIRGNHTTTDTKTGTVGNYVSKIGLTKGALIDNIESYENNGNGVWFDEKSSEYVIRNNYIHSNKGVVRNGVYDHMMGRGLYLEKLWAGGIVENNLLVNNSGPGIMLVNTNGLIIRNNLIARHDLCITYVSMTTSGYEGYTLKDIQIRNNQCKDWARWSGIHAMGGTFTTPWEMKIYADGNTYEPVRAPSLAWWPEIREANTIPQMQSKFKWEQNGRIGTIAVP